MPIISRRRSFAETVEGRRRLLGRLKIFLIVFLAFELLTGFFMAALSVSSTSMAPTIQPGDRLLATPAAFGPATLFGKLPGLAKPRRGDLVLVDPPFAELPGFWRGVADSVVRFVTFQQVSLISRGSAEVASGPFVCRVVGVPGDTVRMEGFVFTVRPADGGQSLTEFEFTDSRYDIEKPSLPAGWQASYPLSGSMRERSLGADEYFVANDSRGASADSRLWGTVGPDRLRAKVFFRYWPFRRMGRP